MAAGQAPMTKWDPLARQWPYVAGAYGIHWIGRILLGQIYAMQVFAACVSVLVIYALAIHLDANSRLFEQIVSLGKYSLFSYVAQIMVLQILYRAPFYDRASPLAVACLGGATLAVTWGAVCIVESLRLRSHHLDGVYRAVFG